MTIFSEQATIVFLQLAQRTPIPSAQGKALVGQAQAELEAGLAALNAVATNGVEA